MRIRLAALSLCLFFAAVAPLDALAALDYLSVGPRQNVDRIVAMMRTGTPEDRRAAAEQFSTLAETLTGKLGSGGGEEEVLAYAVAEFISLMREGNATVRVRVEQSTAGLLDGLFRLASSPQEGAPREAAHTLLQSVGGLLSEASDNASCRKLLENLQEQYAMAKIPFTPTQPSEKAAAPAPEPPVASEPPVAPAPVAPAPVAPAPVAPAPVAPAPVAMAKPTPAAPQPKPAPKGIEVVQLSPAATDVAPVRTVVLGQAPPPSEETRRPPAPPAPAAPARPALPSVISLLSRSLAARDERGVLSALALADKLSGTIVEHTRPTPAEDDPVIVSIRARLRELLTDTSAEARRLAAQVCGKLKDPQAVDPLIDLLGDRDPDVAVAAREALEAVTGKNLGADPREWKDWRANNP